MAEARLLVPSTQQINNNAKLCKTVAMVNSLLKNMVLVAEDPSVKPRAQFYNIHILFLRVASKIRAISIHNFDISYSLEVITKKLNSHI